MLGSGRRRTPEGAPVPAARSAVMERLAWTMLAASLTSRSVNEATIVGRVATLRIRMIVMTTSSSIRVIPNGRGRRAAVLIIGLPCRGR